MADALVGHRLPVDVRATWPNGLLVYPRLYEGSSGLTWLRTIDHAVGPSHINSPATVSPHMLDESPLGCMCPPPVSTRAQTRRKPDLLTTRGVPSNSPPMWRGCCGGGILTAEEYAQEASGYIGWYAKKGDFYVTDFTYMALEHTGSVYSRIRLCGQNPRVSRILLTKISRLKSCVYQQANPRTQHPPKRDQGGQWGGFVPRARTP